MITNAIQKNNNVILNFFSCGAQLIISSKNFVEFNWESNRLSLFAHFPNIAEEISWFQG